MFTRPEPDSATYLKNQLEHSGESANSEYSKLAIKNAHTFLSVLREWRRKPASFLDVGCREGTVMQDVYMRGEIERILGIDIVPQFVKVARTRGLEVLEHDLHKTAFADASIDAVFCSQTLEHCHDIHTALAELFRIAKHAVFIGVPLQEEWSFKENPSHYWVTDDTLEWLNLCHPPKDWELVHFYRNKETTHINMIFLKVLA